MRSPKPADLAARHRGSFSLRLGASLLLTVAAIGATQYFLAARQMTQRVVEQATAAHVGDARVLRGLHGTGEGDAWKPVRELLGHIASRPGVTHVAVVRPDTHVAAVGMRHAPASGGHGAKDKLKDTGHGKDKAMDMGHGKDKAMDMGHGKDKPMDMGHGKDKPMDMGKDKAMDMEMDMPMRSGPFTEGTLVRLPERRTVDSVLVNGRSEAVEDPAGNGRRLYATPVMLEGGRHVLLISKTDDALHRQLSDVRWVLLLTLVGGTLLALPLFYLVGGRSLSARYALERQRSSKDALTGLGNHRSFHEDLRRLVEVAQRRDGTVSLALVDVDNFKQVNDTEGHAAGDAVLMRIAELLGSGRAEDTAYRVGGDEFALLLPHTSAEDAETVLERLRCRVAEQCDQATTSIGVAEIGRPAGDAESLLACADLALYEAKDAGRNRVCVSRPSTGDRAFASQ